VARARTASCALGPGLIVAITGAIFATGQTHLAHSAGSRMAVMPAPAAPASASPRPGIVNDQVPASRVCESVHSAAAWLRGQRYTSSEALKQAPTTV
jgi:hypothetical protein